jgi:hypothetical protein
MPEKSTKIKVKGYPDYVAPNDVAAEDYLNQLNSKGVKPGDVSFEDVIPERQTDLLDRIAGGTMGAALGVPFGGLPGAAVGGVVGAMVPPRTMGDAGAQIFGALTGGPVGKLASKGAQMLPKAGPVIRGAMGLGEAEAGSMIKSGIDTGTPEGFNPISLQGAAAAIIPNAMNSISQKVQQSVPVVNQKLREMFGGILPKTSNEEIAQQATTMGARQVPEKSIKLSTDGYNAFNDEVSSQVKPFQDIVTAFESQSQTLQAQLDALKQSTSPGIFGAAQNLAKRAELEKQIFEVNKRISEFKTKISQNNKAITTNTKAETLAEDRIKAGKATASKTKQELDQQVGNTGLTVAQQRSTYRNLMLQITESKKPEAWKKAQRQLLTDRFKSIEAKYKVDITSDKLDKTYVEPDVSSAQKGATAARNNILEGQKALAANRLQVTTSQAELKNLREQLAIPEIKTSLDFFKSAVGDKALLPRNVKTLADASNSPDDFINAVKQLRTDDLQEVLKFIPPGQQDKFKQSIGDAVIYDFFARSYDPKTKMFSNIAQYTQKYGLPNLEFFTGSPDAAKRFADLTTVLKNFGETQSKTGGPVLNYLKAASIKSFAISGLTALFGASHFITNTAALGAAGAGTGAVAVAIPILISNAMKNPKLASDFIKFVNAGGSLSYSQLPYLSAYLKKEGKPITENQLAQKEKMLEELKANETPEAPPVNLGQLPVQLIQPNQQAPTSPAPVQQPALPPQMNRQQQ